MNKYIFKHVKAILFSLLIGFGFSYVIHSAVQQNLLMSLEIESDMPQTLQLFYTIKKSENFSEKFSLKKRITQINEFEKISFALPVEQLHLLRLDFGKGLNVNVIGKEIKEIKIYCL